jgi:hypothetical protein
MTDTGVDAVLSALQYSAADHIADCVSSLQHSSAILLGNSRQRSNKDIKINIDLKLGHTVQLPGPSAAAAVSVARA